MSVRSLLRIAPAGRPGPIGLSAALLGFAVIVAACSGAAGQATTPGAAIAPGTTDSAANAPASAAPSVDWVDLLSPDPSSDATPTPSQDSGQGPISAPATPRPTDPTSVAISTTRASGLLSQVDHLLNQLNGELSNADAAANNPGE